MICSSTKISENLKYHLDNNISLAENVFRHGSEAWGELLCEARKLYDAGFLNDLDENDFYLLNCEAGEIAKFEDRDVMLDCPVNLFDDPLYNKIVYTRESKDQKIFEIKFKA